MEYTITIQREEKEEAWILEWVIGIHVQMDRIIADLAIIGILLVIDLTMNLTVVIECANGANIMIIIDAHMVLLMGNTMIGIVIITIVHHHEEETKEFHHHTVILETIIMIVTIVLVITVWKNNRVIQGEIQKIQGNHLQEIQEVCLREIVEDYLQEI